MWPVPAFRESRVDLKKKANRKEESSDKSQVPKITLILLAFFTINFALVNKTLDT